MRTIRVLVLTCACVPAGLLAQEPDALPDADTTAGLADSPVGSVVRGLAVGAVMGISVIAPDGDTPLFSNQESSAVVGVTALTAAAGALVALLPPARWGVRTAEFSMGPTLVAARDVRNTFADVGDGHVPLSGLGRTLVLRGLAADSARSLQYGLGLAVMDHHVRITGVGTVCFLSSCAEVNKVVGDADAQSLAAMVRVERLLAARASGTSPYVALDLGLAATLVSTSFGTDSPIVPVGSLTLAFPGSVTRRLGFQISGLLHRIPVDLSVDGGMDIYDMSGVYAGIVYRFAVR